MLRIEPRPVAVSRPWRALIVPSLWSADARSSRGLLAPRASLRCAVGLRVASNPLAAMASPPGERSALRAQRPSLRLLRARWPDSRPPSATRLRGRSVFASAKPDRGTAAEGGTGCLFMVGLLKAFRVPLRCASGRVRAAGHASCQALKGFRGINRCAIYSTLPCPRFASRPHEGTANPRPMKTEHHKPQPSAASAPQLQRRFAPST